MNKNLSNQLEDSILAKKSLLNQNNNNNISKEIIYNCIFDQKKIFLWKWKVTADAQHLTAELLIRLRPTVNRKPIPAICLQMDSSQSQRVLMIFLSMKFFRDH